MKNQIKAGHGGGYTVIVFSVIALLALGAVLIPRESDTTEPIVEPDYFTENYGSVVPRLYVADSVDLHESGDEFVVELRTDSQSINVNAVNATLGYDRQSVEFIAAETTDSAFAIEAQTTVQDGIITIARGHIGGVQGDQLVARLRFKALAPVQSSTAIQTIVPQSALYKHEDSTNIL